MDGCAWAWCQSQTRGTFGQGIRGKEKNRWFVNLLLGIGKWKKIPKNTINQARPGNSSYFLLLCSFPEVWLFWASCLFTRVCECCLLFTKWKTHTDIAPLYLQESLPVFHVLKQRQRSGPFSYWNKKTLDLSFSTKQLDTSYHYYVTILLQFTFRFCR